MYALLLGMSLKKTSPRGVGGRALGEPVALGDERPVLAGDEDLLELLRPGAGLHGLGPVLPEPSHGVGEDLGGVLAAVAAGAPVVVDLVAGEGQGPLHLLVGHPPVAAVDVQVVSCRPGGRRGSAWARTCGSSVG